MPAYGEFGAVTIRWAKGTAGSGPRRRTVLTVPEVEWVVDLLKFWIHEGGRDRFPMADRSAALWPSDRADRITLGSLGDSFAAAGDAVGLPKELGLHCLRHSYITHLHAYASVTSVYTSVGDDFKQKTIQKMITRRIARPEEANPDG